MSDPEAEDGAPEGAGTPDESDAEELPESVPEDWLDQKPFDPAGR